MIAHFPNPLNSEISKIEFIYKQRCLMHIYLNTKQKVNTNLKSLKRLKKKKKKVTNNPKTLNEKNTKTDFFKKK